MAYGELGFDLLQAVKTEAGKLFAAGKTAVLTKAGTVIAQSPQGKAAIKQSLYEQGVEKAATAFDAVRPFIVPGLVVLGVVLLTRKRR